MNTTINTYNNTRGRVTDALGAVLACLIMSAMCALFIVTACTPDKDKYGNYTKPLKYWTDSAYFCDNFEKDAETCRVELMPTNR